MYTLFASDRYTPAKNSQRVFSAASVSHAPKIRASEEEHDDDGRGGERKREEDGLFWKKGRRCWSVNSVD